MKCASSWRQAGSSVGSRLGSISDGLEGAKITDALNCENEPGVPSQGVEESLHMLGTLTYNLAETGR